MSDISSEIINIDSSIGSLTRAAAEHRTEATELAARLRETADLLDAPFAPAAPNLHPEGQCVPMADVKELLASISWRATRYAMDHDRTNHDAMMEAHTDIRSILLGYRENNGNPEPCDCMERYGNKPLPKIRDHTWEG